MILLTPPFGGVFSFCIFNLNMDDIYAFHMYIINMDN
jgi:hypothetical protein